MHGENLQLPVTEFDWNNICHNKNKNNNIYYADIYYSQKDLRSGKVYITAQKN